MHQRLKRLPTLLPLRLLRNHLLLLLKLPQLLRLKQPLLVLQLLLLLLLLRLLLLRLLLHR